jgi:hypothetical protein
MGDQQHGTVSGRRKHVLEQARGGWRVEVSRRLVEDEHRRVCKEGARGVEAIGQRANPVSDPRGITTAWSRP